MWDHMRDGELCLLMADPDIPRVWSSSDGENTLKMSHFGLKRLMGVSSRRKCPPCSLNHLSHAFWGAEQFVAATDNLAHEDLVWLCCLTG